MTLNKCFFLFLYKGTKTIHLINYQNKIYFLRQDNLLVSVMANSDNTTTCSLYDLKDNEVQIRKCIKLNSDFETFQRKISFS